MEVAGNTTAEFRNISLIENGFPVSANWVAPGLDLIFGVFGNGIALFLLIKSRNEHNWLPFYILYCGLAITDFSGIALVYPFVMKRYESQFEWSLKSLPGLCDFVSFMLMWGLMSTGLIICAMSVNRFHTTFFTDVFCDNCENDSSTKKKYVAILISIWIFSAIIAIMPIAKVGHNDTIFPGSWCFLAFAYGKTEAHDIALKIYSYIYSTLGLTVFAVTSLTNLLTIGALLSKRSRRGTLLQANQVAGTGDKSILIFIFTLSAVFAALWTPLMVNIFQHATGTVKGNNKTELLVIRLAIANSVIDPWIYIMTQKEVIRRIRNICTCCTRRSNEIEVNNETERSSETSSETVSNNQDESSSVAGLETEPLLKVQNKT